MAAITDVVPSVETLSQFETTVPCTVKGCTRTFPNTSARRMHIVKAHAVTKNEEEKLLFVRGANKLQEQKQFYCPVQFCPRNQKSKRPFSRLGQLKQHYMTVHAEKKHVCKRCGRGFGLLNACRRHEEKCGEVFVCSCGCPYTTREALLTHARRHQHSVPVKKPGPSVQNTSSSQPSSVNKPNIGRDGMTSDQGSHLSTSQARTALHQAKPRPRYCPILPKPTVIGINDAKTTLDSTSQTNYTGHQRPYNVTSKDAETQTISHTSQDIAARNAGETTVQNMFTQTCQPNQNWSFNAQQSSIGTQATLPQGNCGFGVNAADMLPCLPQRMFELSESFTQTPDLSEMFGCSFGPQQQGTQAFCPISMGPSSTLHSLNKNHTQTCMTVSDIGTTPDVRGLSSIQTQTAGIHPTSLEDNETQTLISVLGLDAGNSTESATQTQQLFDDFFCVSSDVEFADTHTQTWLVDLVQNANVDAASDFVEDLVSMHTQTVLPMADCDEFGNDTTFVNSQTQTTLRDRARNNDCYLLSSGCQTDDIPVQSFQ